MEVSTGLHYETLDVEALCAALSPGKINIYSGPVPTVADAAVTGALLCTITNNSTATGITLVVEENGMASKPAAEVWSGAIISSGLASYYRYVTEDDTGAASITERRVQGSVARSGADLNLYNPALSGGDTLKIDGYVVSLPTL